MMRNMRGESTSVRVAKILGNSNRRECGPCRTAMPGSSRNGRIRLMTPVRWPTNRSRTRCLKIELIGSLGRDELHGRALDIDPSKTAAMTLDEVERWLAHAIVGLYHRELHRGIGATALAAWQRGLAGGTDQPGRGATMPVADPRRFLIDFLPMERRLVRRQGVFLFSIAYWSDVLRTLIGEREKMIVRYDPRDLSRVHLLTPDGAYYDLSYADLRRPPISLWEHRLALKRLRDEDRTEVDEDAIFGAIERMRGIAAQAISETKTMRRQRERRLQAAKAVTLKPAAEKPATPDPSAFEPLPENERLFTNVEEWL